MQLNQSDPEYHEAMRVYLSGQWTEAQKGFNKLAEKYPQSEFVFLILGNIDYSLGKLDKAVELYNKAVEVKPEYGYAYYKLGVCYYRMGRLDDSLASFSRVVEMKSQSHAMASYFIGLIQFFLGHDAAAEEAFSRFRTISPESGIANFYLAQLKIKQKKYEEARALLDEILSSAPDFAEVYYLLGVSEYGLHNNTAAIKRLRQAIELNPDDERSKTRLSLLTDVQWP